MPRKLTALAVVLIVAVGPAIGSDASFQGDAFVAASISEPSNLIPFFASDTSSAEISRLVFNGLVKYNRNLKLVGDLAERWDVSEDGLTIVFHLRRNVRWQDGRPFTSEDVVFTFGMLTDPDLPTPYGADFEKVKSLTAIDLHTVEVVYKEPFSPGLGSWGMGILPAHLLKDEDIMKTSFSRKPVGTGPYLLKKWVSGEKIELVSNPLYYDGRPNIDRYVYRIIPDQSTSFLELQTGNVDASGLTPLQFARQTSTPFFDRNYKKYQMPSFGYTYLGYNLENPMFADKNVRKAIGMAIDKREIVDVTLMGYGREATGPFLPDSWAHDEEVVQGRFNPEEARRLLDEAGWKDSDGDGIRDKDGKSFSFTILTNQGNDQRKMACEMIQKRLADVGIRMQIRVVEWSAFLKEFIDKKRFEAVLLAWQLTPDPDIFDIFHSSKTGPGQFNFVSFKNEEVDRLLEQGRRLFGEDERAEVYRKLHRLIADEEPYTFLYVPESLTVVHRRFRGIEPSPAGLAHNFIRWYVPSLERKYPSLKRGTAHG